MDKRYISGIDMKIIIVSDGPYGERAHATIKNEFNCELHVLEPPDSLFADEIEIRPDVLKALEKADLIITYTLHPDLTLDLINALYEKVEWIIVGAWRGEGFRNQLEQFGNVTCPENMCDLIENGNPIYDAFVSKFGSPLVGIKCDGDEIVGIDVLRSSPCGSTFFVAEELVGEKADKELPIKAGLKIQHYPCRAPKMRLFADECRKEMAAQYHKEAFQKALEKLKN